MANAIVIFLPRPHFYASLNNLVTMKCQQNLVDVIHANQKVDVFDSPAASTSKAEQTS